MNFKINIFQDSNWNIDNGGFDFRTSQSYFFVFMSGIPHSRCLKFMKHLKTLRSRAKECRRLFSLFVIVLISMQSFGQKSDDWKLERMPAALETDYALSSLPPRLRDGATVYLLDPGKGYYKARQGTNGFSVLVLRTQWEKAEFLPDQYTAISYDAEGTKTFLPVWFDAAEMRATGKFSALQIRDIIVKRVKDGIYKPPSREGISYMLCPISRTVVDKDIINQVMPHYMFYAPGVENKDIGGAWDSGHSPFAINSGDFLDKEHSIFNLIILPAGETEKARIIQENKNLLVRLAAYKPYFKIEMKASIAEHHH